VGIAAKKNSHQPHSSPASNSTLGGDKSTLGGDRVLYWSKQIIADIEQKKSTNYFISISHFFKKKKTTDSRHCREWLPAIFAPGPTCSSSTCALKETFINRVVYIYFFIRTRDTNRSTNYLSE
jgi:hypothetical protein